MIYPQRTVRVIVLINFYCNRHSDSRGFIPYRRITASYFGTIVYRSYKPKTVKYLQPNWPARQGDKLLYRFSVGNTHTPLPPPCLRYWLNNLFYLPGYISMPHTNTRILTYARTQTGTRKFNNLDLSSYQARLLFGASIKIQVAKQVTDLVYFCDCN